MGRQCHFSFFVFSLLFPFRLPAASNHASMRLVAFAPRPGALVLSLLPSVPVLPASAGGVVWAALNLALSHPLHGRSPLTACCPGSVVRSYSNLSSAMAVLLPWLHAFPCVCYQPGPSCFVLGVTLRCLSFCRPRSCVRVLLLCSRHGLCPFLLRLAAASGCGAVRHWPVVLLSCCVFHLLLFGAAPSCANWPVLLPSCFVLGEAFGRS